MKSVFEVDFWKLILGVVVSKLEGFIVLLLVSLEVDSSFNESIFDQELSSFLGTHMFSDLDRDFAKFFLRSISLCNSKSFFPHFVSSVHVNSILPCVTFDVVMFSLLQVALHLKGLSQVMVSVLEKVFSELGHKSDHLIILLVLSVDVNSKIWLVSSQIHSFGILESSLSFKLVGLLDVEELIV